MSGVPEDFDTHLQEVRRGTIMLACLRLLARPGYGYGLLQELAARGFQTEANTLYPLLRRLEQQGYLTSEWNTEESRPRKFYRASPAGEALAHALMTEWSALSAAVAALDDPPPRAH